MKLAVPRERRLHERRVAASPETAAKFVEAGMDVFVERGAGLASSFRDADYEAAGATIAENLDDLLLLYW